VREARLCLAERVAGVPIMTDLRCAEVEARFVDVVDGRLDPADTVRFHAHIEGCAACRERAALWSGLVPRLRDAEPPGPDAMATRRMQVEVERRLAGTVAASPARQWRPWWAPAFGLVAAAAGIAIWLGIGTPERMPATVGYAAFRTLSGDVRIGDQPLQPAARVPVGAPIVLATGAAVELALDDGAALHVDGPGQLALDGSAHDVAVRLTKGKLDATVTHRRTGATFAVITHDLRVAVRGTTFSVVAADAGSRVAVSEGQVEVRSKDGRTSLVSAGDSFDSTVAEDDSAFAPAPTPAETDRAPGCADVVRSCQATARAVRASMRAGEPERALRLIADARRAPRAGDASCPRGAGACDDELLYLHAETLNQARRLDEAVAAYRALDRRGGPAAMRQNALYAAAQIERRQGHLAAAATDFERASAAAPRGALHEEALLGAMESAQAAGDPARARTLAARYLEEYPRGLGAAAARKLAGNGAP
jgi:ferric-dicitrate binding protein FerR (iron transport regulator)